MDITLATYFHPTGLIAAFDYDWTLVKPKQNRKFPKDVSDLQWLYDNIPNKLRKLYSDGYNIVIFSNQSKPWKVTQIKNVMSIIPVSLDGNNNFIPTNNVSVSANNDFIPVTIIIATEKQYYKPNPILFSQYPHKVKLDKSFFVGDALDAKIHFSDSDRKFAEAIGLKIYSPEQYFLEQNNEITLPSPVSHDEIIIMVGYPGSGKSTIANAIVAREPHKYKILSKDLGMTDAKIIKTLKTESGSFIIDNTNPSEKRNIYIMEGKSHRFVHCNTSFEESLRRNNLRPKPVPLIAFYVYRKNFVQPPV